MTRLRVVLALLLVSLCSLAHALTWDDLWTNHNQQGYRALTQGDPKTAAQLFTDSRWQGTAYYRMGDYQQALQNFSKRNDATSFYNRGNALAHLGRYKEAIKAYDQALALNIHLDDARINRALLQKILNNSTSAPKPKAMPPYKDHYEQRKQQDSNTKNDSQQDPSQSSPSASDNTNTASPEQSQQEPSQQSSAPHNEQAPIDNSGEDKSQQPMDQSQQPTSQNIQSDYSTQQQQALQNINDDPGELLQRKFARDYNASQQQGE